MIPLNIYLDRGTPAEVEAAVRDYGERDPRPRDREHLPWRHALAELRRHAPRAGRLLRLRRDRVPDRRQLPRIPEPPTPEAELAAEPWYSVGRWDVFPEEFEAFLLADPRLREPFARTTPSSSSRSSGRTASTGSGRGRWSTSSRTRSRCGSATAPGDRPMAVRRRGAAAGDGARDDAVSPRRYHVLRRRARPGVSGAGALSGTQGAHRCTSGSPATHRRSASSSICAGTAPHAPSAGTAAGSCRGSSPGNGPYATRAEAEAAEAMLAQRLRDDGSASSAAPDRPGDRRPRRRSAVRASPQPPTSTRCPGLSHDLDTGQGMRRSSRASSPRRW